MKTQEELYNRFMAASGMTLEEIDQMDLADLVRQIGGMRATTPDTLRYSDREIAIKVQAYAHRVTAGKRIGPDSTPLSDPLLRGRLRDLLQKPRGRVKLLGIGLAILMCSLIGASLGFLAGRIPTSRAVWRSSVLPTGQRADHFVVAKSEDYYACVESMEGALFKQEVWEATWIPAEQADDRDYGPLSGCHIESPEVASRWRNRPRGTVIQALQCRFCPSPEACGQARYVILSDGTVGSSTDVEDTARAYRSLCFAPLGLAGGAMAGAVLFLGYRPRFVRRRRALQDRDESPEDSPNGEDGTRG
jgi:hypothetical protein